MSHDYRSIALNIAGHEHADKVDAVAAELHYGESMHMHDMPQNGKPCSYCWLRAGRAVRAMVRLAGGYGIDGAAGKPNATLADA
jgi:hypothetical protein